MILAVIIHDLLAFITIRDQIFFCTKINCFVSNKPETINKRLKEKTLYAFVIFKKKMQIKAML